MDKSVDNNINQLHPSKILDEMDIAWNDTIEKKTSQLYKKVSSVIPDIEWPYFAPYIEAINILKKEKTPQFLHTIIKHLKFTIVLVMCEVTLYS